MKPVLPYALIHSPNDEYQTGKSWYFQDNGGAGNFVSQTFYTHQEADSARKKGKLIWEKL